MVVVGRFNNKTLGMCGGMSHVRDERDTQRWKWNKTLYIGLLFIRNNNDTRRKPPYVLTKWRF